jgi:6-phosphogluconate dehydrogenase (decarboxylating)
MVLGMIGLGRMGTNMVRHFDARARSFADSWNERMEGLWSRREALKKAG